MSNDSADLRAEAEDIFERLPDGASATVDGIEESLETLVGKYDVPMDEARRSVISNHTDDEDVSAGDMGGGEQEFDLGKLDTADEWGTAVGKVVDLWDSESESVAQVGLIGDETGRTRFVSWETSDLPTLEEGAVYRLENVVTDEYEGDFSIKLNSSTVVHELDEDIEVGDGTVEFTGLLADVQRGSGLIKRCPEEDCTRTIQDGRCSEHGAVDVEDEDDLFDLRIKAVLDDGEQTQRVIFDDEATEQAVGFGIDEAVAKAQDALDTQVVTDEIKNKLVGQYYRVEGINFRGYLLVDDFEVVGGASNVDSLLTRARSI
jgi:replication factor A1